jgi:ABC-type antimicrobial peptide transport system permease subunit
VNQSTLIRRGLSFYRRTHLGVIAGCAVSAAVLSGALFVGDSVKGSLERIALARLGRIHVALDSANRYFRDDLSARIRDGLKTDVAAALHVQGMALRDESGGSPRKQINRVEVLGIDARFLALAGSPAPVKLAAGQAAINEKLAAALGAKAGDEIALRMFKPGLLSREAPLASKNDKDTRRSLVTVVAVLSDAQLGRFSLKSDQAGPHTAFVDLAWLQATLDLPHRANLIAAGETRADPREWLRSAWTLEDLGLSIRTPESRGVVQLQSERIYLDPAVAAPARELRPDSAGVLYYLVNSLSSENGRSTPYSFVTAVSPAADPKLGPVPPGMKDDEILVNRWLADQLSVKEGDRLQLAYSELTAGNAFVGKSRGFRIRGVIGMDALAGEKDLVPEFPGLTDVNACKNWKIGIPMDEEKLKDPANEEYWNKYRQTPKAFVTLAAGREMWANRHGDLMAVRYLATTTNGAEIRDKLRDLIDPEQTGLVFRPVREIALKAASESMDLGQLFLGMSIFLVAASLILTAMFFVFSVEQRAREMGVLFAVGYTPSQVRRLFLAEGAVLAVLGSVAGIPLGWGFARFLVWGLGSAWSGAVADASIEFHARAGTAAIGAVSAALISLGAMAVALWRQAKRPVRELVSEDFSVSLEHQALAAGSGRLRRAVFYGGMAGAAAVAAGTLAAKVANPAGAFFAAGGLLLIAGLARVRMSLGRLSTTSSRKLSVGELGVRNAARRPGRSLATAGMLACGCFVVLSVSAMKEDLSLQAAERRSGTGGFRLYAESSIAIPNDLNDESVRKELRLTDKDALNGVALVPLRVHEGDDASCLNLNLSLTPPLLGVDAARLAELGAFAGRDLWALLDAPLPDGAVPALVGDSATAMWKLKKKAGKDGDLLDYRDERGRAFKVKLVGALPPRLSVLQGRLLISNAEFTRLYPSEGGFRTFLIDAPAGSEERVMSHLSQRLETAGFDLVPSVERLKEFYVVESSYLRMFMVLGGLGLLLGSAGMGILVLRHVMERRGELALLRAVGYTKDQAAGVVMAEHRFLLAAGLAAGTVASALAVGPSALQPQNHIPFPLLAGFLIGTAVLSLAWIRIATTLALRAPLVPALRHE